MLTPYLIVRNRRAALDFYTAGFGAEITFDPMLDDSAHVSHSEFELSNGSKFILANEHPEHGIFGPSAETGAGLLLVLETPDLDAAAARLEGAGAKVMQPVEEDGHGGRAGRFRDLFGYIWIICDGN